MNNNISLVSREAFQAVIGPHCNPDLTVVVSGRLEPENLHFLATGIASGAPHERVLSTIDYLKYLHGIRVQAVMASGSASSEGEFRFIFQTEDVPGNRPSASWETMTSWNDVTLIPDPYYFHAQGYQQAVIEDVPWNERKSRIIWRGSTTGLYYQRVEDLDALPRYQLCKIVSEFGRIADVGINAVVQAADPDQERAIRNRLIEEGLLKPFIPMTEMVRYRYILDIDGNSNSWNFMMKLRLGCCVLRVASDWQQWFAQQLKPWVHYVPIAKDLTDAADRIDWCLDNAAECSAIAERGAAFARAMRFDDEMAAAAASLYRMYLPE